MEEQPIGSWLADLASRSPAPGGGAVAALCAATAAGLIGMVASYTTGGRWSDREQHMRQVADEASTLRAGALTAAQDDVTAFQAVSAAYGLPSASDGERGERSAAIQRALVGAAEPPVRTGELAARVIELAGDLAQTGNPNVVSDVAVAASAARAALESAIINIEINAAQIREPAVSARLGQTVKDFESAIAAAEQVVAAVREKIRR